MIQDQQKYQELIDPIQQLMKGNILPIIATIQYYDLNTLIDPATPLLHFLCKNYCPLQELFKNKRIEMTKNIQGKTPLYFAVQAKDIQAVYWCLKNQTQLNCRTYFGMTATMECVKRNFHSGFLLCLGFGHITEDLPHIAAQIDDVWALKVLKTLNINLNKKNSKGMSPLELAVYSYSYESAYYLAEVFWEEIKIQDLKKLTQSKVMIQSIQQIITSKSIKASIRNGFKLNFANQATLLIILFFVINILSKISNNPFYNFFIGIQAFLIIIFYMEYNKPTKREINIQKLLQVPQFPYLDPICPECLQIRQQSYQHCDICDVCVKGYHFHEGVCVSQKNQVRWFLKDLGWLLLSEYLLESFYSIIKSKITTQGYIRYFESLVLLYDQSTIIQNYLLFYILIAWIFIKKSLRMFEFLYMMITGYTYQQMYYNERYEYLYKPIQVGKHFKNKRIYLFDNGVYEGFKKGLRNILSFFI